MAQQALIEFVASQDENSNRACLQAVQRVCAVELRSTGLPRMDEPELPNGYRHIRSAIGALLILGSEYAL